MQTQCGDCGKHLSQHSLWRHKKKSCNGKGIDTTDLSRNLTYRQDIKENNHKPPNDPHLSRFIDNVINKNPEGGDNNMIQPIKSTSMGNVKQYPSNKLKRNSGKETVQEILSVHEAAKKMNIVPESYAGAEDESFDTDSSTDDDHLDEQEGEHEHEDMDTENNDDIVIERGNEGKDDTNIDNDSEDDGVHRLTDFETHLLKDVHAVTRLEDRLYRNVNNMKVYGLNLDADKGLTNVHILKYMELLKVPKFRGIFMRDELPKRINPVECGIVNLSPHEQLGTHWICYAKVHNTRIYFDSFGRKTPLEIQKYLKTADEFRNIEPVIQSSTNIVQREDTSLCGHLCIFVLTSLIREHSPFQKVIDELKYGYSKHYW